MGKKVETWDVCDRCHKTMGAEIIKFKLIYQSNFGTDASGNRSLGDDYLHLEMHQKCFNEFAIEKMYKYIDDKYVQEIAKETPYAKIT